MAWGRTKKTLTLSDLHKAPVLTHTASCGKQQAPLFVLGQEGPPVSHLLDLKNKSVFTWSITSGCFYGLGDYIPRSSLIFLNYRLFSKIGPKGKIPWSFQLHLSRLSGSQHAGSSSAFGGNMAQQHIAPVLPPTCEFSPCFTLKTSNTPHFLRKQP